LRYWRIALPRPEPGVTEAVILGEDGVCSGRIRRTSTRYFTVAAVSSM
jgi:hypothetical protein